MSNLEQLAPAGKGDVIVYAPYYARTKQQVLPYAIALYQQGSLEGNRIIEGGDSIPFIATWFVSKLPSEVTRCRLQFDGQADLSYEVTMPNNEFVEHLIDLLAKWRSAKVADFPQTFYKKLLNASD